MIPFDPAVFKTSYPQFASLDDDYLTEVFYDEAIVLGAKGISLFCKSVEKQSRWGQIVLAHILTISGSGVGTGLTGRLSSATEGSVSGATENMGTINSAWWDQTPYGQKYWQLIKQRGGATYFGYGNSCNGLYYNNWW